MTARFDSVLSRQLLVVGTVCALFALGGARTEGARLTSLPGNETEAAWSPDGRRIAFQYEYKGDRDIYFLDVAGGEVSPLVAGKGQACYPGWTSDGLSVVYSFGRLTTTAAQAIERGVNEGFNLFQIGVTGGPPHRLTSGRVRDYTSRVTRDGKWLWFTSTRGLHKNSAALFRMPFDAQNENTPEAVFGPDSNSTGAVQPDPSPDGRHIAFGRYTGIRGNWQLWLLDARRPERTTPLTRPALAAYGPRWSPDGRVIACTGFAAGDPGWGVYLIDPKTGRAVRLDTGPGNSRSPDWSPDGRRIVFENNRSGSYDLHQIEVPPVVFRQDKTTTRPARKPVVRFDFSRPGAAAFEDLTGTGNNGVPAGDLPRDDGGLVFGKGTIRCSSPKECDFGKDAFYVTVRMRVVKHTGKLRLVVVCDYPEHHLGWQVFLNSKNQLYFNARSPSGSFVGAHLGTPLPAGKSISVTGVRDTEGGVSLFLDGALIDRVSGALMKYGPATQIRVGCQFNGASRFERGLLYSLEVGRGLAPCFRTRPEQLREFYR